MSIERAMQARTNVVLVNHALSTGHIRVEGQRKVRIANAGHAKVVHADRGQVLEVKRNLKGRKAGNRCAKRVSSCHDVGARGAEGVSDGVDMGVRLILNAQPREIEALQARGERELLTSDI